MGVWAVDGGIAAHATHTQTNILWEGRAGETQGGRIVVVVVGSLALLEAAEPRCDDAVRCTSSYSVHSVVSSICVHTTYVVVSVRTCCSLLLLLRAT